MDSNKEKQYGSILGYLYTALQAVIGIIYVPFLLNTIGKAEYGLYQIAGSIIAYFSAMESPLSSSILKFYTEYKTKGDIRNMENTLAYGKRIFLALTVIMFIVSVLCIFLMNPLFSGTFTEQELLEVKVMFAIMVISLIISMNNYVYIAVINANEKFVFLKASAFITLLFQPITAIVLITKYKYAFVVVIVSFIYNLLLVALRYYYAKYKIGCKIVYHNKDSQLIKQIVKLSLSVFFVAIADQIFWRTDQIILGSMCGVEAVAEYSIGSQINTMYIGIACVLSGVLLPTITNIIVNGTNILLNQYFAKIGRLQSYIVTLILFGVIILGRDFIFILTGEDLAISYQVALFLMIPYAIDLTQTCGITIMQAKNMYHFRAWTMFISAVLNVALTIILIKKMGPIGAAISSSLSIVIGNGFVLDWIYYKKIKLDIRMFFRQVAPIWFAALLTLPLLYVFGKYSFVDNVYLRFIVEGCIYVIIFSFLQMIIAINREEKSMILSMLRINKASHGIPPKNT